MVGQVKLRIRKEKDRVRIENDRGQTTDNKGQTNLQIQENGQLLIFDFNDNQ